MVWLHLAGIQRIGTPRLTSSLIHGHRTCRSISPLGEFVTVTLIEFVWYGFPKSKHGTKGSPYRPGDSAATVPNPAARSLLTAPVTEEAGIPHIGISSL